MSFSNFQPFKSRKNEDINLTSLISAILTEPQPIKNHSHEKIFFRKDI